MLLLMLFSLLIWWISELASTLLHFLVGSEVVSVDEAKQWHSRAVVPATVSADVSSYIRGL